MQLKELVAQLFPEPEYTGQCRMAPQQFLAASEDAERAKRAKVEEAPREYEAEIQSPSASPSSIGCTASFCLLPIVVFLLIAVTEVSRAHLHSLPQNLLHKCLLPLRFAPVKDC